MKHLLLSVFLLFTLASFSQIPPPTEETIGSPLLKAIDANDLTEVKQLIAAGADVNEGDFFVDSPMKRALQGGNYEIIKLLVESGAKDRGNIYHAVSENNMKLTKYLIENEFDIGESIVNAAENNNLEMVKFLASKGAKVDFSQKRRTGLFRKHYVSPIDEAVSHNNLAMVNVLIEHGLPLLTAIESSLDHGRNDLIFALSKDFDNKGWLLMESFTRGNDPVVNKLISQGVPPNSEDGNGNSMLLIAASKGNLLSVQKCVEEYKLYLFKKNNDGENALMKAAENGSRSVCEYLLGKGITIDAQNNKGETALFYALSPDSRSVFDFLKEKGANIHHKSLDGNTLLIKAAIRNHANAMIYLLSIGVDALHVNKEGKAAFYYVVSNSNGFSSNENQIQNSFIAAGADINTRGSKGETILFEEIERGKYDRVIELVEKGADPNTQDLKGERPACSESEIIKFLVGKGADINATDNWDNTYLCEAIKQNDLELAHFLIDQGIDVNKRCYFDEQAIIKAIKGENATFVQFLTENGADLEAMGYGRKNVMDYAKEVGNAEIISYLRSKGAMTKEEKNEQYKASIKLESEIKAALIAEDLESVISLMSKEKVIILQEKVVQDIAYVAAKHGHTTMMNKLISNDIDFGINSPVNNTGQTVLFVATIYAQNELVLDLLAKGADANQKDKNGKTAVDYVSKKSTKKIFKKWTKTL